MNALADAVPWLVGGDADLGASTKTVAEEVRRLRGGRRARAATSTSACASTRWRAIANGMAYHGGVRPFVATFFCFSDYMRPPCGSPRSTSCPSSSSGRTTRSASAKTARRTSPSSTCVAARDAEA